MIHSLTNKDNNINNQNNTNEEDNKQSEIINIDFNKIYNNLTSQKILGKHLKSFDKNDLRNLGFNLFDQQIILYNSIKQLIEKYPNIDNNNKDNNIYNQIEGANIDITNNEIINDNNDDASKYNSKYICPITNKLMKYPVMAFDGNIYEKDAIIEYLKENKCTPLKPNNKLKDNNQIEMMINMLFPDDQLRKEIEKLKK